MTYGEPMPHDAEREAMMLSAMAYQTAAADVALSLLTADDFFVDRHRRMFEACVDIRNASEKITSGTIRIRLKERGSWEQIGSAGESAEIMLRRVIDESPAVASVPRLADHLRQKTRLRRLIAELTLARGNALKNPPNVEEFIGEVEQRLFDATRVESVAGSTMFADLVSDEMDRLNLLDSGATSPLGCTYGIAALDAMTHGMHPGEVTVVAGRPGIGKSALGVDIARAVAKTTTDGTVRGVLFASLEMKCASLCRRAIAAESKVETRRREARTITGQEHSRHLEAMQLLHQVPIFVDQTPRMKPSYIRSQVRRHKSLFDKAKGNYGPQKLSVVVVDYLQRMGAEEKRRDKFVEVGENMNSLADMAKDLDVHVVVLSQINRENTKRTGESLRPRMSDLAESGDIERAAHTIVLLHRPEYYEQDKSKIPSYLRGKAELIVEKQREGRTGIVQARWCQEVTSFTDASPDDLSQWASGGEASTKRSKYGNGSARGGYAA